MSLGTTSQLETTPQAPGLTHFPPTKSPPGAPQRLNPSRSYRAHWCTPVSQSSMREQGRRVEIRPWGANGRNLAQAPRTGPAIPREGLAHRHPSIWITFLLSALSPALPPTQMSPFAVLGVPAMCQKHPEPPPSHCTVKSLIIGLSHCMAIATRIGPCISCLSLFIQDHLPLCPAHRHLIYTC